MHRVCICKVLEVGLVYGSRAMCSDVPSRISECIYRSLALTRSLIAVYVDVKTLWLSSAIKQCKIAKV